MNSQTQVAPIAGPRIQGYEIVYADHSVVAIPQPYFGADFIREYLVQMAADLSKDGDVRQHAKELRLMNNDGTWIIRRHAAK